MRIIDNTTTVLPFRQYPDQQRVKIVAMYHIRLGGQITYVMPEEGRRRSKLNTQNRDDVMHAPRRHAEVSPVEQPNPHPRQQPQRDKMARATHGRAENFPDQGAHWATENFRNNQQRHHRNEGNERRDRQPTRQCVLEPPKIIKRCDLRIRLAHDVVPIALLCLVTRPIGSVEAQHRHFKTRRGGSRFPPDPGIEVRFVRANHQHANPIAAH